MVEVSAAGELIALMREFAKGDRIALVASDTRAATAQVASNARSADSQITTDAGAATRDDDYAAIYVHSLPPTVFVWLTNLLQAWRMELRGHSKPAA